MRDTHLRAKNKKSLPLGPMEIRKIAAIACVHPGTVKNYLLSTCDQRPVTIKAIEIALRRLGFAHLIHRKQQSRSAA